jgi:hypothetical protein
MLFFLVFLLRRLGRGRSRASWEAVGCGLWHRRVVFLESQVESLCEKDGLAAVVGKEVPEGWPTP